MAGLETRLPGAALEPVRSGDHRDVAYPVARLHGQIDDGPGTVDGTGAGAREGTRAPIFGLICRWRDGRCSEMMRAMSLPAPLRARLRLPLIAAPMFLVSGPELVIAACRSGVIGAFPTVNCRTGAELDQWLGRIMAERGDGAPPCAN